MKKQFFIVFLLTGMVACTPKGEPGSAGNPADQPEVAQGTETLDGDHYTYQTATYSIQYPADWKLDRTSSSEVEFQLFSPLSSPDDKFSENVNLLIQDFRGQPVKTLDQYVELSESQILIMLTDSKLQLSERKQKNGREYHRIEFTSTRGEYKLKQIQYYYFENQIAYALTFTCELSEYDRYRETGMGVLEGFGLKRQEARS